MGMHRNTYTSLVVNEAISIVSVLVMNRVSLTLVRLYIPSTFHRCRHCRFRPQQQTACCTYFIDCPAAQGTCHLSPSQQEWDGSRIDRHGQEFHCPKGFCHFSHR